jgi:hypothetical protein
MKKLNFVVILFLLLGTTVIGQKKTTINTNDYASFGEKFKVDRVYNKSEMLKKYKKLKKGDTLVVQFESNIKSVCKKKGCWMNVELANGEVMKVTFKDYAFFVPTDNAMMAGKEVIMQGTAKFATISVEDQKHYAEDGGATKVEMDAIKEPKNEITFEANGVLVPVAAEATK